MLERKAVRHAVEAMLDGVEHGGKAVAVDNSRQLYAPGKDALPRINVRIEEAERVDGPEGTLRGRTVVEATLTVAVTANSADAIDDILAECGSRIASDETLRGTVSGHVWDGFELIAAEEGETVIVQGRHDYAVRFVAIT